MREAFPPSRNLFRIPVTIGLIALCQSGCGSAGDPSPADPPSAYPATEIVAAGAPEAIGPYSQAVRASNTLYLSGQIGLDPETNEMVSGGIEAETQQVMENLLAVLRAAGLGFEDVVQTQVFLADLEDFATMNEIYGSYLEPPFPTRATIEASRLPRDARVEIMMTAIYP